MLPEIYADARLVAADPPGAVASPLTGLAPALRRRAVLMYADGRGALSHTTALDVWALRRQPADEPLHLSIPQGVALRSRSGLVVHRRIGFEVAPPQAMIRGNLRVVRIERALVEAWPLLAPAERPESVIGAVNQRLTTPDRIGVALMALPRLSGRAELRVLLDRLAAGCRSALEIWGHDHVFTGPGMPRFQRQVRIQVANRTMYLDVYAERERVAFELDGAATHGDPRQREIDLRRDALLATVGIMVVRFSHRRLVHDTAQVRREIIAILATR
ncbi:endonuclease domain-containing protein [Micromonospora sp. NBC_01796]|uniref:endonuclease domain-containing protein n=1 Tax=Micromonospora sp. NBC_01796 TaxID=2975987 RepID=UPI002DD9C976|nr:DUF559 domain-containing protein [Micromonospora sp. NBC_01796]WSA84425.1 endonuclease domain-containing protein [Micromonospora sp. NBC_01796]